MLTPLNCHFSYLWCQHGIRNEKHLSQSLCHSFIDLICFWLTCGWWQQRSINAKTRQYDFSQCFNKSKRFCVKTAAEFSHCVYEYWGDRHCAWTQFVSLFGNNLSGLGENPFTWHQGGRSAQVKGWLMNIIIVTHFIIYRHIMGKTILEKISSVFRIQGKRFCF